MALLEIKDLNFTYPNGARALTGINLKVEAGEFIVLMGTTGSGKTTLMRMIKTALRPHGEMTGSVLFDGEELTALSPKRAAGAIGYVLQNPEHQIVTDKVYHELAFGLENLGIEPSEIRRRVGEMASYFGISWFKKDTFELAGGEKQILNLAGILVMQPELLLMDEPTSQLDPIAALNFLNLLKRINQELGITIILAEHRLEAVFPVADRILVMDRGKIIADGSPREIAGVLDHPRLVYGLPAAVRIFRGLNGRGICPLSVREGRDFLSRYSPQPVTPAGKEQTLEAILSLKNISFSYGPKSPDILSDLNLELQKGEIFGLVGANGSGKTTLLKIIAGLYKPYLGKVKLDGRNLKDYGPALYTGNVAYLPQDPQTLFIEDQVRKELRAGQATEPDEIIGLLELGALLDRHPYDLSGGEQQQVAFGKILLRNPRLILLDEPTKGLDPYRKKEFADLLRKLQKQGITILIVTHDLEFAANCSDRCGLLFDGRIVSASAPGVFFSGNNYYTTSANRIARHRYPDAILAEEVIARALKYGESCAG